MGRRRGVERTCTFAVMLLVLLGGCSDPRRERVEKGDPPRDTSAAPSEIQTPDVRGILRTEDPPTDIWVVPHAGEPSPQTFGRSTVSIDATALQVVHTEAWIVVRVEMTDLQPLGRQALDVILDIPGNGSADAWAGTEPGFMDGLGQVDAGGPRSRSCKSVPADFDFARDRVTLRIPRRQCLGDPDWVEVEFIATRLFFGLGEGRSWSDNVAGEELGYVRLPRIYAQ